jgi:branched-chain amino acid transport system substrate-binding protein
VATASGTVGTLWVCRASCLPQCGDILTRQEVMTQASHLNMEIPMLLAGIKVAPSPTDYRVMKQLQLERFDGEQWRLFGGVIEASAR